MHVERLSQHHYDEYFISYMLFVCVNICDEGWCSNCQTNSHVSIHHMIVRTTIARPSDDVRRKKLQSRNISNTIHKVKSVGRADIFCPSVSKADDFGCGLVFVYNVSTPFAVGPTSVWIMSLCREHDMRSAWHARHANRHDNTSRKSGKCSEPCCVLFGVKSFRLQQNSII